MRRLRLNSLLSLAVRGAIVVAGVLMLGEGCRAPTEVIVEIDTDVPCSELQGVDIIVAQDPDTAEHYADLQTSATSTRVCDPKPGGGGRVGTLVVTPAGTRGSVLVIAGIKALSHDCRPPLYTGCIVARRTFAFIDHVTLHLPIVLDPVCLDVPCNALSTCTGKQCVKSDVSCEQSGKCSPPGIAPDGGLDLVDASRGDAPSDGPADDGAPDSAAIDSGVDAPLEGATPSGACPMGFSCPLAAGGAQVMCPTPPDPISSARTCCYGMGPNGAACIDPGSCIARPKACCNSRTMCGTGWCCANTFAFQMNTEISCHPLADCTTYVCSMLQPTSPECPPAAPHCKTALGGPGFFACGQ